MSAAEITALCTGLPEDKTSALEKAMVFIVLCVFWALVRNPRRA